MAKDPNKEYHLYNSHISAFAWNESKGNEYSDKKTVIISTKVFVIVQDCFTFILRLHIRPTKPVKLL